MAFNNNFLSNNFFSICIQCVLFTLLLFVSCGMHKEEDSISVFEETEKIFSSKTYETEDVYMRYPFRICKKQSRAYVIDIHALENYCHEFEYPNMKYIRSFAKKGTGAGEFLDAENVRANSTNTWILDANRGKISKFDCEISEKPIDEINLSKKLLRTLDFDFYNDSVFIVPDYTGESRFCFVDMNGEIIDSFYEIPTRNKDENIANIALAQAWRSFLDYNEENGILALATQLGQVIEFYDLKNKSLVNIFYGTHGEPQFSIAEGYAIPKGIMGYSDIYVGKTHIYAIFWGHSFESIMNGGQNDTGEGGRYIHQFDLKGNPVKEFILDKHITGFLVDEENRRIIGLDVNQDQPIVEFLF